MTSNKANATGFTGNNVISEAGDCNEAMKHILSEVPVTITEQEVDDMNVELDIRKYNRPLSRLTLALIKAVDYLKVRLN